MQKVKVTYTHKGWMGLCHVYMTNPCGNEPLWPLRVTGELKESKTMEFEVKQ